MIVHPMNWHIYSVFMHNLGDCAVFYVCTNIGVSSFCPSWGEALPDIVVKFLEENAENCVCVERVKIWFESGFDTSELIGTGLFLRGV